jgi:hypothetical protein
LNQIRGSFVLVDAFSSREPVIDSPENALVAKTLRACHAQHPEMTLKSATPCVKATSRSSTARPQEKGASLGQVTAGALV